MTETILLCELGLWRVELCVSLSIYCGIAKRKFPSSPPDYGVPSSLLIVYRSTYYFQKESLFSTGEFDPYQLCGVSFIAKVTNLFYIIILYVMDVTLGRDACVSSTCLC